MARTAPDPGTLDFSKIKDRLLVVAGALAAHRVLGALFLPWVDVDAVLGRGGALSLLSGGHPGASSVLSLGIVPALVAAALLHIYEGRPAKSGSAPKRWLTLLIALIQSAAVAWGWSRLHNGDAAIGTYAATVLTLSAGAMATLWLAELIDEKGIGNGAVWIVFGGIAAQLNAARADFHHAAYLHEVDWWWVVLRYALILAVFAAAMWILTAQRKVKISYAKRVVGRRLMGGQDTVFPLRMEASGGLALLHAAALLTLPATLALFAAGTPVGARLAAWLAPGACLHQILLAVLTAALAFVHAAYNPQLLDAAANVRKMGGFIPGLRSGEPTLNRLRVLSRRLALPGGVMVGVLAAAFPMVGAAAILVLAGAALDAMGQIEAHLMLGGSAAMNKGFSHKTMRRGR